MTLLLIIIYTVFISLGLPDSMLGAAWPVMYKDLQVDVSLASAVAMMNLVITSLVSFFSGKYIRKFGTYKMTIVSIGFTICGMLGMSLAPNLIFLMLFSGIVGIGGGAVDSALNSYIAKYYSSRHMNWLHAFWGVGVSVSPLVLSIFLKDGNWRAGHVAIAFLQSLIFLFVFWKRGQWNINKENFEPVKKSKELTLSQILNKTGIKLSILSSGLYSALEFTVGTWCASFLVLSLGFSPDAAARGVSVYFAGIMTGRILIGFVSERFKNNTLILVGSSLTFVSLVLLLPGGNVLTLIALFFLGMGYGPIFPSQLHRIPEFFGKTYAADIIGFHMAGAYTMGFLAQVAIGFVASRTSFAILPYILLVLCGLLLGTNAKLLSLIAEKNQKKAEAILQEAARKSAEV